MAPYRPLFRKRDSTNDTAASNSATFPNPVVSATATDPDSFPRPSSPHAISSDIDPHAGYDTDPMANASDTEEEDNTELERYYLTESPNDSKAIGTIFGKGIGVWESHGGTMHTYLTGETTNSETMPPGRRKRTQRSRSSSAQNANRSAPNSTSPIPLEGPAFASTPAPTLAPVIEFRTRDPARVSTIFHQGSAVINPLGACMRPFVCGARQRPQAVSSTAQPEKRRRVVSGSFGTFESAVSRFEERQYRLGLSRAVEGRMHGEKGTGAKAMGRPRAWMR